MKNTCFYNVSYLFHIYINNLYSAWKKGYRPAGLSAYVYKFCFVHFFPIFNKYIQVIESKIKKKIKFNSK